MKSCKSASSEGLVLQRRLITSFAARKSPLELTIAHADTQMVGRTLLDKGAQGVMLGDTDLALDFDQLTSEFPLIDCPGIHVDAIVRLALG